MTIVGAVVETAGGRFELESLDAINDAADAAEPATRSSASFE